MMGKRKKAGASLTPSHRAPRAYFSFSPAFLRHKQASERNFHVRRKKFSNMYQKIKRSVKTRRNVGLVWELLSPVGYSSCLVSAVDT